MSEKDITVRPSPSSLIESMRDIGYSMETAIADIIDNSLAAEATGVHIRFNWNEGDPWLIVVDNGKGMTDEELTNAMRLGSQNPLVKRDDNDLGRFGLGLKTASFSQCRLLTVISRKSGVISGQEWNLDKISEDPDEGWKIRVLDPDNLSERPLEKKLIEQYLGDANGTVVLWRKMDRFDEMESKLVSLIDVTRQHIELTFHRYLSPDPGRKQVTMTLNGDQLSAFNPFNPRHPATEELTPQPFKFKGQTIMVKPYVLPHHNKITREEYRKYAGEGGYIQNQGFYVYRNRRLIIRGTWFRLHKKEELSKLVRVQVDIPNTLDDAWKINVNKSQAFPPEPVRNELRTIIEKIVNSGKRVYRQRGARINHIAMPAWSRQMLENKIQYRVNRDHPVLKQLEESLNRDQKQALKNVLSILENGFPADLFFSDMANKPEQIEKPELDYEQLHELVNSILAVMESTHVDQNLVVENLLSIDPFASNKEATLEVLKQKGYLQ